MLSILVLCVAVATAATAAAAASDPVSANALGPLQALIDALKVGGPYAGMALALYWAWRKDGEKNTMVKEYAEERKEMHASLVTILTTQTQASTEMRGALVALKEAIERLVQLEQQRVK